jgi:hypothetical protein
VAADGIAALEGRLAAKASLLAENTAALEAKVAAITAPVAADKAQQVAAHAALQVGGEQGHRAGVPYGCIGVTHSSAFCLVYIVLYESLADWTRAARHLTVAEAWLRDLWLSPATCCSLCPTPFL